MSGRHQVILGSQKESLGRGSTNGEGALTSPQGSLGRSTPEAGSRSDRFLPDPCEYRSGAEADIVQEENYSTQT